MGKLLKIKDKLLLSIALLSDIYVKIYPTYSAAKKDIFGISPFDYRPASAHRTLYRSLKTKEIKKIIRNGRVYYQLTSIGQKKLTRKFPLLDLQKKKWDGLWRIVIFDIIERKRLKRDSLRAKLKELGFGMWQQSVYITPFNMAEDIRDFIEEKKLQKQVCIFEAKELLGEDIKILANEIWQVKKINTSYQNLIKSWEKEKLKLNKKNFNKIARKYFNNYLKILKQDPFLPKELLPQNWQGDNARELVKEWFAGKRDSLS